MFQTGKQEQEQSRAESKAKSACIHVSYKKFNNSFALLFSLGCSPPPIPLYLRQRLSGKDMDTLCSAGGSILAFGIYSHIYIHSQSVSLPPSLSLSYCVGGVQNTRNVHKLRFSSLRHIIYHPGRKEEEPEDRVWGRQIQCNTRKLFNSDTESQPGPACPLSLSISLFN